MIQQRIPYIALNPAMAQLLRERLVYEAGRYRWNFLTFESGRAFTVKADDEREAVATALRALSTGEVIWRR